MKVRADTKRASKNEQETATGIAQRKQQMRNGPSFRQSHCPADDQTPYKRQA